MKKLFKLNKVKRTNIPLRRKMASFYQRAIFCLKILSILLIYLLFFNKNLNFIKEKIINIFYHTSSEYGLKLRNVIIEGQKNIASSKLINTLEVSAEKPILEIDLEEIKDRLEHNSWIKSAIIKRNLPDSLHIIIDEREPVAIWQIDNKLFLIDSDGYKISSSYDEKFNNLMHVVGSEANIYASKLIVDLNHCPELALKVVSAVRYGQRRWDLNFAENITVKFPENNFLEAYEYLIKLNNLGKFFNQNYKSLDLRDSLKYYLEKYPEEAI